MGLYEQICACVMKTLVGNNYPQIEKGDIINECYVRLFGSKRITTKQIQKEISNIVSHEIGHHRIFKIKDFNCRKSITNRSLRHNISDKICCGCKKVLPIQEFYTKRHRENPEKLSYLCRSCISEQNKKRYENKKDAHKKLMKNWREKNRDKLNKIKRKFSLKARKNLYDCYVKQLLRQAKISPTEENICKKRNQLIELRKSKS